ncbi:MAG: UDP-N-acetylmuramoyl-L-alanine--D-glutamate ligase [Christensenellaceae bacterium]|jgi:UDP-N-acetylmuramoylalanine--D-glutamate ligase|nr:UDP-N-acetylmuramoyl-L-alanine--D-glutamate ligase [Christensenellaceae bacterium]
MKVLILGGGVSGKSAKDYLEKRGDDVVMFDQHIDMCVVSPGIQVTSELDLGFLSKCKKVVAVTGTNGKTTVVTMLHEILGDKSVLCGNVGTPVTAVADQFKDKIAIVEVSSFQLEIPPRNFKPDISVILNITQDHLERHGTMQEYINCKSRIAGEVNVVNSDDPICRQLDLPNTVWFGGATHIEQNTNAVKAVLELLGVKKKFEYKRLPHRIEHIRTLNDVEFYDDSKATNVSSTLAACRLFEKSHAGHDVNLILGGLAKGQDFSELFAKLPSNVKNIFVIGDATKEILKSAKTWNGKTLQCQTMDAAIIKAAQTGTGKRIVLLSPACASFDMFKNYAHRGEVFKAIVADYSFQHLRQSQPKPYKRQVTSLRNL